MLVILFKKFKYIRLILVDKKKVFILFLSSTLICSNWFIYIWSIDQNHILETSLGYFINPILTVLLSMLFLNERLSIWKLIAIFIALMAVIYQVISIGFFPWIALSLATTFGFYALLKKKFPTESQVGLFIETSLFTPVALFYLLFHSSISVHDYLHYSFLKDLLLVCSGVMTTLPLIFFNNATKKLKLSTVGFFQYINPSMGFFIAIFLYNEPISIEKLFTFGLLWSL